MKEKLEFILFKIKRFYWKLIGRKSVVELIKPYQKLYTKAWLEIQNKIEKEQYERRNINS